MTCRIRPDLIPTAIIATLPATATSGGYPMAVESDLFFVRRLGLGACRGEILSTPKGNFLTCMRSHEER